MLVIPPAWRRRLLFLAPLLAGAVALTAALTLSAGAAPDTGRATSPAAGGPGAQAVPPVPAVPGLLVHVSGAVAHPGLYRLNRGDRVTAAIAAAGGITSSADPQRLPDLAGRLRDGQQVRVPQLKGAGGTGGAGRASLNSATAEELAAIPGFSPDLAQEVVDHRQTFGPFGSIRELVSVLGMSQSDYLLAKSHIRV